MTDKPIIGVTVECRREPEDERTLGSFSLNWNYAQAVSDAGGVPVVIPPSADPIAVVDLIDGWLIPGGMDIDAAEFGESNHPKAKLQEPARFDAERILFQSVAPDLPVLGICYGCQFLNVVRGGTLEQHVPDRVGGEHHAGGTLAAYELEPGSRLAQIAGQPSMQGKSYHHQAVGRLAEGMRAVARHDDGTVEAIEAEDRPWMIGVQWHPERTLDDPATRRLFREFVAAAKAYRAARRARGVRG